MLGIALSQIGLSLADFCALDLDEFEAVYAAWIEGKEAENRDNWERMRLQTALTIQPHVRKRIIPRQILPMPWDEHKEVTVSPVLTAAERQARFERRLAQTS